MSDFSLILVLQFKTLREKQTKKVDLLSIEEAKKRKPNLFD
jgi:hypothetical protein